MKFKYIKETDSLFVILSDEKSADSIEIADGVIADVSENGKLVGIEFYSVKNSLDLENLLFEGVPFQNVSFKNFEPALSK
jgi:uncharacterized protein YuzE